MKKGQVLRGYRITTAPTNEGAGNCVWSLAEKDGKEYFVKEFIKPKRPRPESMGTRETKLLLINQCEEFERRQWSVIDRIDPRHRDAGNLVTTVDFFHEGTRYYKITERLHVADLDAPHELNAHQKSVLLTTLGNSLRLLHGLSIVHGDLKPQNVLLYQPPGSDLYTAKLIDFDDAYVSGEPSPPNEIGGDTLYGAPEWTRWVQRDPTVRPAHLTTAADMFAVGLMLHTYLVGSLPGFDGFGSPADAVNARAGLRLDPRLPGRTTTLIRAMVSCDPSARPRVGTFVDLVADEVNLTLVAPGSAPAEPVAGVSRVRKTFGGGATSGAAPATTTAEPAAGRRPSRLRVNLNGRESRGSS